MNPLDSLFEWLLAASLRASILAIAIIVIQATLRRWLPGRWRHALWLPMILVLILPVLPELPVGTWRNPLPLPAPVPERTPDPGVVPPEALMTGGRGMAGRSGFGMRQTWALVWLAGAGLVAGFGLVGHRRTMRRIAAAEIPTDQGLAESVAKVAAELRLFRAPRVVVSPAVDSPAVTGIFRPVLLLPEGFPRGFTADEARLILLHELTHLKRHDLPLNGLLCLLQVLHWFNPVLWFAFARMRDDRESACDAQVLSFDTIDRRGDYGHALLKLQGRPTQSGLSLGLVGIFERSAGLRTRIHDISRHQRAHPVASVVGAAIVGVLTVVGATRAQEPKSLPDHKDQTTEPMSPARKAIEEKLDKIILPLLDVENATLVEVIKFIRPKSIELDQDEKIPSKKGVNFVIRQPRNGVVAGWDDARITLRLEKQSLREVLRSVAEKSGSQFKVDDFAITFMPVGEVEVPRNPHLPKARPGGPAVDAAAKIIIPSIVFKGVTLEQAVELLNSRAKEIAAGAGVPEIKLTPKAKSDAAIGELSLVNVPLSEAVRYCAEKTSQPWSADGKTIWIGW